MAIAPDGRIFIGEMTTGNIQVYKPGQAAPVLAGTVSTRFENEDGLLGVALPPDFATSQFLYVMASDPDKVNRSQVLWRYKVNGDKLDASTKTEILRIPRWKSGIYHDAGGLHFDKPPGSTSLARPGFGRSGSAWAVSGFQPITLPEGAIGLDAFDLSGRKVWTYRRNGATGSLRLEFPGHLASGLLRVHFL